jgi:recombination protein RecA
MKTESSQPASRASNVDLAITAIHHHFGAGAIQRLGATEALAVETLSTGSLAIDVALGAGGLPLGRIAEIYGPESSGKTTFCLSVLAEAQRRGGVGAIIDVEHALDPAWARRCGVHVEDLLVAQPDCGEDALTIAEILIRSAGVDVIVVDSVAALVPKSELDGQMGDAVVGAQARLMSQAMRRLTAAIAKTKCILVFTNQIREKIGVLFGSPEFTPGGRALKFFASVRLDIRRKDQIKTPQGNILGHRTKIKVVKNKIAAPFAETEFDILFAEGISRAGTLLDFGLEHGLLEKRGADIAWAGEVLGPGREAAKLRLREDATLATRLDLELRERLLLPRLVSILTPDPDAGAPATAGSTAAAA